MCGWSVSAHSDQQPSMRGGLASHDHIAYNHWHHSTNWTTKQSTLNDRTASSMTSHNPSLIRQHRCMIAWHNCVIAEQQISAMKWFDFSSIPTTHMINYREKAIWREKLAMQLNAVISQHHLRQHTCTVSEWDKQITDRTAPIKLGQTQKQNTSRSAINLKIAIIIRFCMAHELTGMPCPYTIKILIKITILFLFYSCDLFIWLIHLIKLEQSSCKYRDKGSLQIQLVSTQYGRRLAMCFDMEKSFSYFWQCTIEQK